MNFRPYFDETIIFSLEIECKKCWKNSFIIPSGIYLSFVFMASRWINREFKISQRGRRRERLETIQFNYIL